MKEKVFWDRTCEVVDRFGAYDHEEVVDGMDEQGNEYIGTAMISCDVIVDVQDVELKKKNKEKKESK